MRIIERITFPCGYEQSRRWFFMFPIGFATYEYMKLEVCPMHKENCKQVKTI